MAILGLGLGLPFGGVPPVAIATAKPVNTLAPSVSGIQTQGQVLTSSTGGWDQPVTSYAYKWQSSPDGSTWTDISGATSSTYTPASGDVGKFLRSGVLATNSFGSAVAGYAFSAATGAIAAVLSISGSPATTAAVGSAYSFTPGTAGGHTPKVFGIANKPSWAAFSTSTGQLTGTPTGAETDAGIVISVTDVDGLTASLPSFTITVSTSSGPPTFDATQTVRGNNQRSFIDLTAMLASVPTGNMVAVTLTTASGLASMNLNVWQYPDQAQGSGSSYLYAKRELAKNLTVTALGVADGAARAWVTCVYNSGAGETGSPVTYVLGLNVDSTVTTWAMGAKTWARNGGPLVSVFGDGTATAITSQVDKNSVARTAFEIFKGRLVWKSTDGATNTYGRTRSVDYATSLTQSPYTVTLNNGAVVTVTAVDGQWDVAPADPTVINGSGSDADQLTNTVWGKQFARGDVILFEDGDHSLNNPKGSHTYVQHDLQLTGATTGNMPTAPTGLNVMNLEQAGWLTLKSRTPWGAKMGSYTFGGGAGGPPDLTGSTTSNDVGSYYLRFTNLQLCDEMRFEGGGTPQRYGWVQVDSCYADYSAAVNRGGNSTPGLFLAGTSTSPGGRHNIYIHDNWVKWPTIGIDISAEDSEVIGNRIDYASEDAIRWGCWDTGTTIKSKCWWNFMPGKWWGLSSHPDYMQVITTEAYQPRLTTLYPKVGTITDATTFTSTVPMGSVVGNLGCPDTVNNWADGAALNTYWGNSAYTPGTAYQLDDGEGFLGGDIDDGRAYTWIMIGNGYVSDMGNGYYARNASPASRTAYQTLMFDYYQATIAGRVTDNGNPGFKQNYATTSNSGTIKNSVYTGGYSNPGSPNSTLPTATSCNSATYDTGAAAAAVFNDPIHNWSNVTRIQELMDAMQTKGAEAGRGAFADKTKVDHRNRTWDTSLAA